jgi:hypothetical protein
VRAISLQRWTGQFWSGQWEHQMYLAVPTARGGKATSSEAVEEDPDAEPEPEAEAEPEIDPEADEDGAAASSSKSKKK